MKRLYLLSLLTAFALSVSAQVNRAKAEFHFGKQDNVIEVGVGNNSQQLVVLDSIAAGFDKVRVQDRYVTIHSYTSPDGSEETNREVARRRAETVEKLFDSKLTTDAHVIYQPHFYEWDEIIATAKQDGQLPNKEKVLQAIEEQQKHISLKNPTGSEALIQSIKDIDDGYTYSYIARNYFPKMHRVVLEVKYINEPAIPTAPITVETDAVRVEKPVIVEPVTVETPEVIEPTVEPETPAAPEEPVKVEEPVKTEEPVVPVEPVIVAPVIVETPEVIEPTVEPNIEPTVEPEVQVIPEEPAKAEEPAKTEEPVLIEQPILPDTIATDTLKALQRETPIIKDSTDIQQQVQRTEPEHSFWSEFASRTALKTNMLYDLGLVPNLGIESAVTDHISVSADWMYAWWSHDSSHDYWRVYGGDLEVKYWFGNKNGQKLTGHHVGAYGGILTYDVEWGNKGYMGQKWSYIFGLSYGYALPLNRRFRLDFNLGIGYFGGEYYEYLPEGDHYYWQVTKNRRWFGPTKAEISLVWLLGKSK